MKCLSCGQNCACREPAEYPTWPLEQSLTRAGLADVAIAIRSASDNGVPMGPEAMNTANIILSWLERTAQPVEVDPLLL